MTDSDLEKVFAQGNTRNWLAGLRAVYEAGVRDGKPRPAIHPPQEEKVVPPKGKRVTRGR
jgi:hypothetical protein